MRFKTKKSQVSSSNSKKRWTLNMETLYICTFLFMSILFQDFLFIFIHNKSFCKSDFFNSVEFWFRKWANFSFQKKFETFPKYWSKVKYQGSKPINFIHFSLSVFLRKYYSWYRLVLHFIEWISRKHTRAPMSLERVYKRVFLSNTPSVAINRFKMDPDPHEELIRM